MHIGLECCFRGVLHPDVAEDILKRSDNIVGSFLVWKTEKNQVDYVISIKEGIQSCAHYIIQCTVCEDFFKTTLPKIFRYYSSRSLDNSPVGARLTVPVPTKPVEEPAAQKLSIIVATRDYVAQDFSQLSFRKGEVLHLLDTEHSDWWYAGNGTDIGFIPANYFPCEQSKAASAATLNVAIRPSHNSSSSEISEQNGLPSVENRDAKMKFFSCNDDSTVQDGNETMKCENLRTGDTSFVRCILENFKKFCNSSSSVELSSVDNEGYRSYSIDDDIFDMSVVQTPTKLEQNNNVFNFDNKSHIAASRDSDESAAHKVSSTSSEDDVMSLEHESDGSERHVQRRRPLPAHLYDRTVHPVPFRNSGSSAPLGWAKNRLSVSDCMSVKSEQLTGRRPISMIDGTRVSNVWSIRKGHFDSRKSKTKSYYVSGVDLSPDALINASSGSLFKNFSNTSDDDISSTADSGVDNTFCTSSKCLPVSVRQVCEVWGEVGPSGGVIQVPGTGPSLHLSPLRPDSKTNSKRAISTSNLLPIGRSSRVRLGSKSSERYKSHSELDVALSQTELEKDGRIVIGLEDPPDFINSRLQVVTGPMVRVDYADANVIKAGTVLQVEVNVTLKYGDEDQDTENETSKYCSHFACLQSETHEGPFRELSGSYYHYGNTLQVTIDTDNLQSLIKNTAEGGRMFLVPVAKLDESHHSNPFVSVWEGIRRKMFWVGVYGSKKLSVCSTCCVTMSSSGTCPPTLWMTQSENKKILLHLWGSYHLPVDQVQDLHVSLQSEDCSSIIASSSEKDEASVVSEDDIRLKSRIIKSFILRCANADRDGSNFVRNVCGAAACGVKQRNKLFVTFTGLQDGTMYQMQVTAPEIERSLLSSTPVKRWKRHRPIEPPKTMLERRTTHVEKYLYLWYDSQRESKVKLRPAFEIPSANRNIISARIAVAIKSRNRGKGHSMVMPNLVQYSHSDVLPILGSDTLLAHGTSKYKEWYVGYSRRKIGLIHTKCVRLLDFGEYCNRAEGKLTVSKVIENIVEPIGSLSYCYVTLLDTLVNGVEDWKLFSAILRFGENFIDKVMLNVEDESERETSDKISLFLEKFKEYCVTGPRRKHFHKEIIRALLYMEHYDLALQLVADFCLLSVSVEIGKRWPELVARLVGSDEEATQSTRRCAKASEEEKPRKEVVASHGDDKTELIEEATWRPAFEFLSNWRRQFANNHRAFLLHLHRVVDDLPDSPNKTWKTFTGAMMLIFSTDSLRRYDTRL